MNQTDRIRDYIVTHFIEPARRRGLKQITVRAGDIHKDLGLVSRMPMVCSALEGRKLLGLADVSILQRKGPVQGANVYITYNLPVGEHRDTENVTSVPVQRTKILKVDPSSTLVLVSCVKSKKVQAAKAKDLYISCLFEGYRRVATSTGARWLILSAKYGLVEPEMVIQPYEYSLNRLGVAERRKWAKDVLDDLLPIARSYKKVVFLAGARYREFLIQPLKQAGLEVEIPMEGLRQGEQLAWLGHAA